MTSSACRRLTVCPWQSVDFGFCLLVTPVSCLLVRPALAVVFCCSGLPFILSVLGRMTRVGTFWQSSLFKTAIFACFVCRISALKTEDGVTVSDTEGLCNVITAFYSGLFRSQYMDELSRVALLRNVSVALPPADAELCEGLLSAEECWGALVGMARRKAPGSDGLPMEFYLKFWDLLGEDLVCVLNSCFRAGCLSTSQRRGVISLSFKKGDRLDIRNWRPISLLNVDYKLAGLLGSERAQFADI